MNDEKSNHDKSNHENSKDDISNQQRLKQLILELAAHTAPSGTESDVQHKFLDHVRDVADEAFIDTLGNGIARKHGAGPHILLAAHADEAGVMVIHIEDDGFLRIVSVGEVDAQTLVGRHVQFTNGTMGVIGVEANVKDVTFDHLYVDIAASTREAAQEQVHIGSEGVIAETVVALNDHTLAGRALDNRVGCAIAIETFRQASQAGANVSLVFTAQQAVGARGARTAAFRLQPDLALVIDAAPAGDMPDAPRMALKLGAGPAIKIIDRTAIVPLDIKDLLIAAAATAQIPVQYEVWTGGRTDAGHIQGAAGGVAIGGVSYPARYVGGPSTVIDLRDAQAAVRLLVGAIERRRQGSAL